MNKSPRDKCPPVDGDESWDQSVSEEDDLSSNSWDREELSSLKIIKAEDKPSGSDEEDSGRDRFVIEDLEESDNSSVWKEDSSKIPRSDHEKSALQRSSSEPPIFISRSKSPERSIASKSLYYAKDAAMPFEGKLSLKDKVGSLYDDAFGAVRFQKIECRTLGAVVPDAKEPPRNDEPKTGLEPGTSEQEPNEQRSCHATESWILLDDLGQTQPVTLFEVNFLLNGRSADAVLQENRGHFTPEGPLARNANSDLLVNHFSPLVCEKLQRFLTKEDVGGEESVSKSIRLERKFGNMLLYIQSGVNPTPSVKFIPIDSEMIHLWRQSKENVSTISSEDNAQTTIEDVPEVDFVACQSRNGPMRSEDYGENGKLIECHGNDVKRSQSRMKAERCRSSILGNKVCPVGGQLYECKTPHASNRSRGKRIPETSPPTLFDVEEEQRERSSVKEALNRDLNDTEEILKCKSQVQMGDEQAPREDPNPLSVNTVTFAESSSHRISETDSAVSWFRSSRDQKSTTEIVNRLEYENEQLVAENLKLKKKLNEISIELEEYVSAGWTSPADDGRKTAEESLKNQVCNLKLELENLRSLAKSKEHGYKLKDAIVREELAEKNISLNEWRASVLNVFCKLDSSNPEDEGIDFAKLTPKDLLSHLRTFVLRLKKKIIDFERENSILKMSLQQNFELQSFGIDADDFKANSNQKKIDEDGMNPEKEIKNYQKEIDFLLGYQLEDSEKHKSSADKENVKANTMEQALRLADVEKAEISQPLISFRSDLGEEKLELIELGTDVENTKSRVVKLEHEICEVDRATKELRSICDLLKSKESNLIYSIRSHAEQTRETEIDKSELEVKILSAKRVAKESTEGMHQCIARTEELIAIAEDNLARVKEKLGEALQPQVDLREIHDEKKSQNAVSVKMLAQTEDEPRNCRKVPHELRKISQKEKRAKKQALDDLATVVESERKKIRTLEKFLAERRMLDGELSALRIKLEVQSKTKDRLRRQNRLLESKYKCVKSECNERTKILKRMYGKLKEDSFRYYRKLAYLEKNVTDAVNKAVTCEDIFLRRKTEVSAFVDDFKKLLEDIHAERKRLESREDPEKVAQLQERRNKYESATGYFKSQISRYKMGPEMMLSNFSYSGKGRREDERRTEQRGPEEKIKELTEEFHRKKTELFELPPSNTTEGKKMDDECQTLKDNVVPPEEDVENKRHRFSELQEFISTLSGNLKSYQKKLYDVSEKLAESFSLIAEEKSFKQSPAEKEKMLKVQLERLKLMKLVNQNENYKVLLENVAVFQDDVGKRKARVDALGSEVQNQGEDARRQDLTQLRATNLGLRKREGILQAKIVRLENQLRSHRLLVKKLRGELGTEKASKKLFKSMIKSTKEETQRFANGKK